MTGHRVHVSASAEDALRAAKLVSFLRGEGAKVSFDLEPETNPEAVGSCNFMIFFDSPRARLGLLAVGEVIEKERDVLWIRPQPGSEPYLARDFVWPIQSADQVPEWFRRMDAYLDLSETVSEWSGHPLAMEGNECELDLDDLELPEASPGPAVAGCHFCGREGLVWSYRKHLVCGDALRVCLGHCGPRSLK